MKIYRNIFILVLTLSLTIACDNGQTEQQQAVNELLFEAGMQPAATRAGVNVQNTHFDENEEVDVYIEEQVSSTVTYAQPIVYTATASEVSQGFYSLSSPHQRDNSDIDIVTWPSTHKLDIYAFYPARVVNNLTSAFSFSIQSDQSTTSGYRQSDLMACQLMDVARIKARVQLTFTHLLSKVIVTLKGDRSLNINHEGWRDGATEGQQRAAQIEANNRLVGARVDLMSIKPTTSITSPNTIATASGSANVYVGTIATTTELVDADDAASAWQIACIIPPQTIAAGASMFKITMADGGVLYYKPAVLCTFTSGHVNTYNITVHAKELTLTGSTIDPWTVGDTDQGHEAQPVITL